MNIPNKNAAIRYQTLDKCFRDRRHKYYIEDADEMNVDQAYRLTLLELNVSDTGATGQNGTEIPYPCPCKVHLLHLEQNADQTCPLRGNL